jgi:hypothetical protein
LVLHCRGICFASAIEVFRMDIDDVSNRSVLHLQTPFKSDAGLTQQSRHFVRVPPGVENSELDEMHKNASRQVADRIPLPHRAISAKISSSLILGV